MWPEAKVRERLVESVASTAISSEVVGEVLRRLAGEGGMAMAVSGSESVGEKPCNFNMIFVVDYG
jgi:hypothetical protein